MTVTLGAGNLALASPMLFSAFLISISRVACHHCPSKALSLPLAPVLNTIILGMITLSPLATSHALSSPGHLPEAATPSSHLMGRYPLGALVRSSHRRWTAVTLMQESQTLDRLLAKLSHLAMLGIEQTYASLSLPVK